MLVDIKLGSFLSKIHILVVIMLVAFYVSDITSIDFTRIVHLDMELGYILWHDLVLLAFMF